MASHVELTELLRESGWLRALAANLMGGGSEAQDLVQDTWLAALRRPPRAEGEPRPWLARVARNLARNTRRDRTRRETREAFAREERPLPGPDALAQEAEAQRLLAEAVTRLEQPLRDVIVLRYFQGLDSNGVGARLGVPASTVRTRLARALEALRADLDRRCGGGREGWALLLAPLVHRAEPLGPVAAAASAAAIGAGASAALLACGVALCALAAAGTIYWSAGRWEGEPEAVAAAGMHKSTLPSVDAQAGSPGTRESHAAPPEETQATSEAQGERPAVLPGAAPALVELSGTILIDGRAPEWSLELTLEPNVPPVAEGDPRPRQWVRRDVATLRPERRGQFAFELPSDWNGQLSVTDFVLESGESALAIDRPRTGIVVALRSGPEIVGRILSPDGRPVAWMGRARITGVREGALLSEVSLYFRTGADGRFRVPSRASGDHGSVEVRVESELHGFLQFESSDFVPVQGTDLGDLVLLPLRALEFRVHDPRGLPIEDARARVEPCGLARASEGTVADGSGRLAFAPKADVDLRVSALGYADRVLRAPASGSLAVVLEPLASLDLRLVGSLATEVEEVRLISPRAAFLWYAGSPDPGGTVEGIQIELGSARPYLTQTPVAGKGWTYGFRPRDDGRYRLTGLVPHVPISVEVLGLDHSVLASHTVSVADGEHLTATLGDPSTASDAPPGKRKRSAAGVQR